MSANDIVLAAAGSSGPATYVEDVFSTYLYTGTGASQTITNGIDLAGKGGLLWIKNRGAAITHALFDTNRGTSSLLRTNGTNAAYTATAYLSSYNSNGYSLNVGDSATNGSSATYASWTFRKQPKFFDIVTYTGDGIAGKTVAHKLGSAPGMIIVKTINTTGSWQVYHRSADATTPENYYLQLNSTAAEASGISRWNNTAPTSTNFTLGDSPLVNGSGNTYVAYLFAHDAGGFGTAGTDNVISCGSYTGNNSVNGPVITLGYEPQFVLIKSATSVTQWVMMDNMRGIVTGGTDSVLYANLTNAESQAAQIKLTATGFQVDMDDGDVNGLGQTYIYMAIRRPMKVPTSGTEVFTPAALTPASGQRQTLTYPADLSIGKWRSSTGNSFWFEDRLRGFALTNTTGVTLQSHSTGAETTTNSPLVYNATNDGLNYGDLIATVNDIYYHLKRASGFFDVVCYTGTSSARTVAHNLGVTPELLIIKKRSGGGAASWYVWNKDLGSGYRLYLDLTSAKTNSSAEYVFGNDVITVDPTSTQFTLGSESDVNGTAYTYVAYLFASVAGVSKVGSYTGTGATQTINCGFTGGARFVMIKRTNSTGDWYVWDTARGIVSGNDPYLLINSTAAEVTSTDYIDPVSSGFEISSTAPAAINASGGSYIFLAIA